LTTQEEILTPIYRHVGLGNGEIDAIFREKGGLIWNSAEVLLGADVALRINPETACIPADMQSISKMENGKSPIGK
jgi:hypothetical protein